MKKIYLLALALFPAFTGFSQQQILLLTETFEGGTNVMNLNGSGVGTNSGTNQWVVNHEYNGQSLYGNTPPQDSVVSGQINAAPFSNYLHIHDVNALSSGIANANWNPANASDRFAYINRSFCTLGMTDVTFTFFWICEGSANAYGEVYYRNNGGPWVKTGQNKYNNQSKWKYEVIQDPAFQNAENLQIGFRWVNPGGGSANVSFGIDDIIAVGTYDDVNSPVHLAINLLTPTTVCQDNYITLGYTLSAPLCDGTYRIQMSDANGNFSNPVDGGVFNITAPDTSGFIGFKVPDNVTGTCFRMRINRISPQPLIIGDTSACFTIIDCPETITTNNAPVMNDADTTCILSVIDVKFNSTGVYRAGNKYTAELSDSTGSFAAPFFLGNNPTTEAFPSMPPGNVSGLIPATVPPGCGYYIRVRSTNPAVVGSVIGPFCLARCDELTNNHTDMQFCVPANIPFPSCSTVVIHPNQWNNSAAYDTCNDWTVELRDMDAFSLVNSGGLGVYHDNVGGNFTLCMPSVADSLPVAPGTYYMRMVSNCSNQSWNQTGSVIRITIGAPSQTPPIISTVDTVYCNLGLVALYVSPFNHPPSDYEWASSGLNNGNAFVWPNNPLLVDFTGAPLNDYTFYVREINYGCYGPYSSSKKITIIGLPKVNITGPTQVCLGDTVTYNVGYLKETYYDWDAPAGVRVLDEANSQATVIFDSIGTFTLSNFSLNDCGGDSGKYTVTVVSPYTVNAGADQTACANSSLSLTVESNSITKTLVTQDTATQGKQGAMFNLVAHEAVTIDSFAVKFLSTQPVQAEIYGKAGSYRGYEQSQFSWNQVGAFYNFSPAPLGQMTVIPVEVNRPIAAGDTFAFYLTTSNLVPINMAYSPGLGIQQEVVYKSDGIIDFVQGTVNNYPFGASVGPRVLNVRIYYSTKSGLHYLWNTGDTTATIHVNPQQTSDYSVVVYDTSGCQNRDTVHVLVYPAPVLNAGPDTTVCKGVDYRLPASASVASVTWEPPYGLDDYTLVQPIFNYQDSVQYIMSVSDSNGCVYADSVWIRVRGPELYAGADTTLCADARYPLNAVGSPGSVLWHPASGLSDATSFAPVFDGSETTVYVVSLTDSFGCIAYDSLVLSVIPCESYIKVPQAFSPNGDGHNDYFTVFGENIADYEIRIYNRWGELVYASSDAGELNDLGRGWNGMYKGKLQSIGTFVYFITAKDAAGKKIEKKGNLTLIR